MSTSSQTYIHVTLFFNFNFCQVPCLVPETHPSCLRETLSLVRVQNQVFSKQYVRCYGKVGGDTATLKGMLNLHLRVRKVVLIKNWFHYVESGHTNIKFAIQGHMAGP